MSEDNQDLTPEEIAAQEEAELQAEIEAEEAAKKAEEERLAAEQAEQERLAQEEDNGEVPTQEYSVDKIVVLMDTESDLGKRIATRLARYANIVRFSTKMEEISISSDSLDDIINLMNNATQPEFIKVLNGLCEFINKDRETFGSDSVFDGIRPFRPFLGACPPQCRFLEVMLRLAPKKTRKATINKFDPSAFNQFLVADKRELFTSFFSE